MNKILRARRGMLPSRYIFVKFDRSFLFDWTSMIKVKQDFHCVLDSQSKDFSCVFVFEDTNGDIKRNVIVHCFLGILLIDSIWLKKLSLSQWWTNSSWASPIATVSRALLRKTMPLFRRWSSNFIIRWLRNQSRESLDIVSSSTCRWYSNDLWFSFVQCEMHTKQGVSIHYLRFHKERYHRYFTWTHAIARS